MATLQPHHHGAYTYLKWIQASRPERQHGDARIDDKSKGPIRDMREHAHARRKQRTSAFEMRTNGAPQKARTHCVGARYALDIP